MKSLERNFVVGLVAALLVTFSVLLFISVHVVKTISEAHVISRLEHDAEALLAALRNNPRGFARLREGRITPIYQQPLSGHYFQFNFADGSDIRSRSLWDEVLSPQQVGVGKVLTYRQSGPGGQDLLLRSAGYQKLGRHFTLTVAEDMQAVDADIRYFQLLALAFLGLTGVVIILVQRWVLRRGFRVLEQVRDNVVEVSQGRSQEIQQLGPEEIRPLTTEINRLLQQLQQRLRRSRDALGNLAHALKGPISVITQDIDHLSIDEADRKNLSDTITRIGSLINRELKRARFSGEQVGQHFHPGEAIPDLIDALTRIHQDRNLQINCAGVPDTVLPFDHEDMLELLGNLLDNACKWARHTILLNLSLDDGLLVQIDDDGPGVNAQQFEKMQTRGIRIDEQGDGHGLGLAIVNDLIQDYQGSILFSSSDELGGLKVSVRLPLPG